MNSNKMSVKMVIETEQHDWLKTMVGKYSLVDTSKALRVLLDYAIEAASEEEMFQHERCRFC